MRLITDKKTGISYQMQNGKNILLSMAWLMIFFLFISIAALVFHEFCHIWEAVRQGGDGYSYFAFKFFHGIPIPISGYAVTNESNWTLVKLAGGFYTGLIFLASGIFAHFTKSLVDFYVEFSFLAVGAAHLLYSFWETAILGSISQDMYALGAHIVQSVGIIAVIILLARQLALYVLCGGFIQEEELYD